MREVCVPFPGHSALEVHLRAGVAARAAVTDHRAGHLPSDPDPTERKQCQGLFSLGGLELVPNLGERNVRVGSQPPAGRLRGVPIPCPEGGGGDAPATITSCHLHLLPPSPPPRGSSAPASTCSARIKLINPPGTTAGPPDPSYDKRPREAEVSPPPSARGRFSRRRCPSPPPSPYPPHANPRRGFVRFFFSPLLC